MQVADLIKGRVQVFSVSKDMTVLDAARYLREQQVRATTVCDSRGEPIGVMSQSDISDKVAAENRCPAWVRVEEIMTRDVVRVTPETTIEECFLLFERHGIYHLVVSDDKRFYGMISAQDLLKVVASEEKARADMLQAWAFPPR